MVPNYVFDVRKKKLQSKRIKLLQQTLLFVLHLFDIKLSIYYSEI